MPPDTLAADAHALTRGPLAALWRTRGYLRPYLAQVIFMLGAALVAVTAQISVPLLTKSIIDGPISHGQRGGLALLALAATGLGAGHALLSFIRRWVQARAVTGMERAMRDDLYAHLQRLDAGFHDNWQSGQLLSRATTDLSAIRRFAGFGTVFLVINVATFVTVIVLLVHLNWWLGLLTAIALLPVVAASTWFERRYRVLSRLAQDQQGDLATTVEEAATGIGVLKALGRRDTAAAQHGARAMLVYQTQVSKARLRGTFWAGLDLIPNTVIGFLLLLGALATVHHELTLGGLVAFITLTLQLVWPIEAMGYILATGQEAATAAQRLQEILDTEPQISSPAARRTPAGPASVGPASVGPASAGPASAGPDPARPRLPGPAPSGRGTHGHGAARPIRSRGAARPTRPHGAARPARPGRSRAHRPPAGLVFDRVAFTYPGAAAPSLREVRLTVEPGQTLALTGQTGSGKTTLLQLVPRLADPTSGRVLLDGTDIRDLPLPLLRSRIGCAFEDSTLFSASVRENVTFGAPDATDTDIEAALRIAQAEFVYRLPWGLQTRIGERGMALSGGQRQRVALARAILSDPAALILDDPLSALDVGTEERVTAALHEVLAGATALVVAHRPSTVALADTVALLADGVIAAAGTHSHLLATQPRYRELMTGDAASPSPHGAPGAGRPPAAPRGRPGEAVTR